MAQTLSNINAFLKVLYRDGVSDVIQKRVPLYDMIKKETRQFSDVGGASLQYQFPIKTQLNQGVGSRSATGTLPTAQNYAGQQATVAMKQVYIRAQIWGAAIAASNVSDGSYGSGLKDMMEDAELSLALDYARQLHGDGSGALCQINGTFNNTIYVSADNPDLRWLMNAMVVDGYTAKSGGSAVAGCDQKTIADCLDEVNTIVFGSAVTINDGSYLFRSAYGDGNDPRNLDMIGMLGHVDDGTNLAVWQGITRATTGNSFTKGQLVSGAAGAMTQLMLQSALQKCHTGRWAGSGDATMGLTDPLSMTYIGKLLTANERFVDTKDFESGWKGLRVCVGTKPVTMLEDRQSWPGYTYFLNLNTFRQAFAKGAKFEWMDMDGATLRRVANSDAYEATLFFYGNLACTAPGANVRLYNYTAPS